jgi:cellobiose dehydrogenase (acceptor)
VSELVLNSNDRLLTFRRSYIKPDPYTGDAKLTQLNATVTDTSFELVYRCQKCWVWSQDGVEGSQLPTGSVQVVGWAQNSKRYDPEDIMQHDKSQGIFGISVDLARNAKYSDWIKLPAVGGGGATPTSSAVPSSTPTPTACVGSPVPSGSYDYIVVGAGAGGIPVADKLSEAGKKVLLIEKGPPSLGRFGGTMGPDWLKGTGLTRFDVPGLCNQIWVDSDGVACTDTDQMAGCVLGGGTAVNAALWWKPNSIDWDHSFPNGWKASEMSAAVGRAFQRIVGTDTPSSDGKLYKQEGYDVLSGALAADGWSNVKANDKPNEKQRTFSHTPYMYANGQRQGPLGTYLVTALARSNFKLWTNTGVKRVIRTGGKATGVELEGGYCGNVTLNSGGRVILSAGTFGSSKLLFRSGIGPKDQLTIVKNSARDGKTFIPEAQWINLPVGQNLNDHVNTDLVVQHQNVSFYDFYQAWSDPIKADKDAYLNKRAGILTQSAPNIGPIAWEVIKDTDGSERQFQWTARVEGPGANDTHSMTLSNYLGRGSTSRGAASINGALNMFVSKSPYLIDQKDTDAVVASLKSMIKALSKNPKITMQVPPAGTTVEDYVASLPKTPAARRANHWIGTAKIGSDSGLNGGSSVVDLNTKVYGTDNIFVVDASIFPA